MNPKILYVIFTHNRPEALKVCLDSLFNKQDIKPDNVLIIDDGSSLDLKAGLFNFSTQNIKCDYFSITPNVGYGKAFEFALKMCEVYDADYVAFIESDYEFILNGVDKVFDVFQNSEHGKFALFIGATDHPDYFSEDKIKNVFPKLPSENGIDDLINREILFKPFDYTGKYGRIKLEFVSNTCGCVFFNWKMLMEIKQELPEKYDIWLNKVVDKDKEKRNLNDGMLSCGAACLWAECFDYSSELYAAGINLKPSVAQHFCAGGINGKLQGFDELTTFVGSPTWRLTTEDYESGVRRPTVMRRGDF